MRILYVAILSVLSLFTATAQKIDRQALVSRNSPVVTSMDTLSSLTVGNGEFAYTVDATGLQSFPDYYAAGVCLGTQSQWGWHSFPNTEGYTPEETLKAYDFGHHSKKELYACQFRDKSREHYASEYFRVNPHRLHLGVIGFDFAALRKDAKATDIKDIYQNLDLWRGEINSHFSFDGQAYDVHTVCHPDRDMVSARVTYLPNFAGEMKPHAPITLRLPYPTGKHVDNACSWDSDDKHLSSIVSQEANSAIIKHTIDTTSYYIIIRWQGKADLQQTRPHTYTLSTTATSLDFSAEFLPLSTFNLQPSTFNLQPSTFNQTLAASTAHWQQFWTKGAAVDLSHCLDSRAKELERRVVLSQYLLAIQCAGSVPPQETGLTMNSWFGKFHLEMILWHQAWLPLWGHADKLERTLSWYFTAEDKAREIARRQSFDGVRWMKMTDPSAIEAPSNVGSFLIWQQPHLIYLSELVYRALDAKPGNSANAQAFIKKYNPLIDQTAKFMYSFANYDKKTKRFILKGNIPAQESLKAAVTFNSPFELSQWHTTMQMAQQWRQRLGEQPNKQWKNLIDNLSCLAYNSDSLYLAAESATDTYTDIKATSDHPALLGALGFFPESRLIDKSVMNNTLNWIIANWNWPTSWGWDFPMTAMTATRLHQPEKAVNALLLQMQKNTYLNNGHNYQDGRLRIYLPGNGGLLSAIALMCAGWDGCTTPNPGFPKDGNWDVHWEGLLPMP